MIYPLSYKNFHNRLKCMKYYVEEIVDKSMQNFLLYRYYVLVY